jgi:transportin-1
MLTGSRPAAAQVRLAERDWKLRESAVLALGAVAEGCSVGLDQLAPQIIQGLLPMLQDPRPLVRSITCWTLGRYSKWLLPRGDKPLLQAPLEALVNGLLQRVLDKCVCPRR